MHKRASSQRSENCWLNELIHICTWCAFSRVYLYLFFSCSCREPCSRCDSMSSFFLTHHLIGEWICVGSQVSSFNLRCDALNCDVRQCIAEKDREEEEKTKWNRVQQKKSDWEKENRALHFHFARIEWIWWFSVNDFEYNHHSIATLILMNIYAVELMLNTTCTQ